MNVRCTIDVKIIFSSLPLWCKAGRAESGSISVPCAPSGPCRSDEGFARLLQVLSVLQTAVQLCTPDRQEKVKQDERPAATRADILSLRRP